MTGGKEEAAWKAELKALVKSLGISVAFDCVAGSTTEALVHILPKVLAVSGM